MEGLKKYINLYGLIPASILVIYAGLTGFFDAYYDGDDYTFLAWVIPFSLSAVVLIAPVGTFSKLLFRVIAFVVGLVMACIVLYFFLAFVVVCGMSDIGPIPPGILVMLISGMLLGGIAAFLVGLRAIGGV